MSIENIVILRIKMLSSEDKVYLTSHMHQRMEERNITENDIVHALNNCEVVESYEGQKYLVLGMTINGKALHIVCSIAYDMLSLITTYWPDEAHWYPDFKRRR